MYSILARINHRLLGNIGNVIQIKRFAANGDFEQLKSCIENPVLYSAMIKSNGFAEAIAAASSNGHLKIVIYLLQYEEGVKSLKSTTSLQNAILYNRFEVTKELLKYKEARETIDIDTIRFATNHLIIIDDLLKYPDVISKFNESLFRFSVWNCQLNVLELLLNRVSLVNIQRILMQITNDILTKIQINRNIDIEYQCLRRFLSDSRVRTWLQNRNDVPILLKSAVTS